MSLPPPLAPNAPAPPPREVGQAAAAARTPRSPAGRGTKAGAQEASGDRGDRAAAAARGDSAAAARGDSAAAARGDSAKPPRPGLLARPAGTRSFLTVMAVGAAASVAALVVGSRPLFEAARTRAESDHALAALRRSGNHAPSGISVYIAPPPPREQPQRLASATGAVRVFPGERVRIGIDPGGRAYAFVISIDETGAVTPVYPDFGTSLALAPSMEGQDLPELIELSGRRRERMVVLLTDLPLELDEIRRAVAVAMETAKNRVGPRQALAELPNLPITGDQHHRLFETP